MASALAERLAAVRRDVDTVGLRWVHPERFHTTLRFLGPVDAAQRAQLTAILARLARATPAVECRLGAAVALPRWRHAQVVAVELDSAGALEALAESVEQGLRQSLGRADKPFRAHVTVVRIRRARPAALVAARRRFEALALADVGRFTLGEFALFRSDTSPDGSRYTAVERFPFAAT